MKKTADWPHARRYICTGMVLNGFKQNLSSAVSLADLPILWSLLSVTAGEKEQAIPRQWSRSQAGAWNLLNSLLLLLASYYCTSIVPQGWQWAQTSQCLLYFHAHVNYLFLNVIQLTSLPSLLLSRCSWIFLLFVVFVTSALILITYLYLLHQSEQFKVLHLNSPPPNTVINWR